MRGKRSIFDNIDWFIVVLYVVLVFMGWINIYAAVYNEEHQSIFDMSQRYGKQLLWILTSFAIATTVMLIDQRFYSSFGYLVYGVVIAMLAGVLLFGTEVKGAQSWFSIGSFALQPSEFAKFATCLALAKYLSGQQIRMEELKTKMMATLIIALPAVLILLQPDTGSTLVYAAFIFVLYREGLSGNIFIVGLVSVTLFITTLLLRSTTIDLPFSLQLGGSWIVVVILALFSGGIFYFMRKLKYAWIIVVIAFLASSAFVTSVDYIFDNVLQAHQTKRIDVLLGLESDPKGAGYNVNQSLIAIGSGGFFGKGLLKGTQTKFDFVPEQSTDFIFCTIGEEWGFLGSFIVIGLFITLLVRIIFLAERQRSKFSRIYGYGLAAILFFHFAVNIGMAIGLAPVIGIPLPFFSYGGSSLWAFTVLLFIFLKLDSDRLLVL
jgi:rod shape determining protein RodA